MKTFVGIAFIFSFLSVQSAEEKMLESISVKDLREQKVDIHSFFRTPEDVFGGGNLLWIACREYPSARLIKRDENVFELRLPVSSDLLEGDVYPRDYVERVGWAKLVGGKSTWSLPDDAMNRVTRIEDMRDFLDVKIFRVEGVDEEDRVINVNNQIEFLVHASRLDVVVHLLKEYYSCAKETAVIRFSKGGCL